MTTTKFQRAARRTNVTDAVGTVQVKITLQDESLTSKPKRGNISRSFSIKNSRVGEVAKYIERTLFGGNS